MAGDIAIEQRSALMGSFRGQRAVHARLHEDHAVARLGVDLGSVLRSLVAVAEGRRHRVVALI